MFLELFIIALVVAIAASLLGSFLILQKKAMMIDAISHTILLGIILAFLVVKNLNSPLLLVSAALVGLLTSFLIEKLSQVNLIHEDSAIGTIFPLLFSIAVILVSKFSNNVHIDVDSVLLGKIEFASFSRLIIGGVDLGAQSLWVGIFLVVINSIYLFFLYKELKVYSFDPIYTEVISINSKIIQTSFMLMISISAVGSFQVVGSILFISFMTGPALTMYLITDDLKKMILGSIFISFISCAIGFKIAIDFNLSISGMIASVTGLLFLLVFLLNPKNGYFKSIVENRKKSLRFKEATVLFHILRHNEFEHNAQSECDIEKINEHLNLSDRDFERVIKSLKEKDYIEIVKNYYKNTEKGKNYLKNAFKEVYKRENIKYQKVNQAF